MIELTQQQTASTDRFPWQRWSPRVYAILAVLIFAALASALLAPIQSAVEIGGDEHFEVSKAALVAKGYPLYERVWNDQPPLHTAILGFLFKVFGQSITVARALAVAFALLLLSSFFVCVKRRNGTSAAYLGIFCLLSAPVVLRLSITAMLEVPALAMGLCALWPLYVGIGRRKWFRLLFSGAIFAMALQVKATAAILAPALFVEILLLQERPCFRKGLRDVLIWGTCVVLAYLAIGVSLGVDYEQAWRSHFSSESIESIGAQKRAFSPSFMLNHKEALVGATVALIVCALRKQWRQVAFPLVTLLTATTIHLLHRPYWGYYYLHFAIPLAWLTAYAATESFRVAWLQKEQMAVKPFSFAVKILIASIVLSYALAEGGIRTCEEVGRIRSLPKVENNPLIARMEDYAANTKWVFAQATTIYVFHARLQLIPELAVLPAKRFWSEQFSGRRVWETVKRYSPEQLLLRSPPPPEFSAYLTNNYVLVYEDKSEEGKPVKFYVTKTLVGR